MLYVEYGLETELDDDLFWFRRKKNNRKGGGEEYKIKKVIDQLTSCNHHDKSKLTKQAHSIFRLNKYSLEKN